MPKINNGRTKTYDIKSLLGEDWNPPPPDTGQIQMTISGQAANTPSQNGLWCGLADGTHALYAKGESYVQDLAGSGNSGQHVWYFEDLGAPDGGYEGFTVFDIGPYGTFPFAPGPWFNSGYTSDTRGWQLGYTNTYSPTTTVYQTYHGYGIPIEIGTGLPWFGSGTYFMNPAMVSQVDFLWTRTHTDNSWSPGNMNP